MSASLLPSLKPLVLSAIIAGFLAVLFPGVAVAKVKYENSVKLHWALIDKAKSYQVQVLSGEKVVFEQEVVGMSTTVILPAGKLAYRLRSVDQTGRRGAWSRLREFTILPGPPVPADTQEAEIPYKGIPLDTILKWQGVEDATAYRLRVWKSEEIVFDEMVSGVSAGFKIPAAGLYKFAVASIIGPAGLGTDKGLTGGFGPSFEFSAIDFKLGAARELSPTGRIAIQDGAKVRLKWTEVKGAEAYEVELIPQKNWKMQATVEADPETKDHTWRPQFQVEGAEEDMPVESARKPAAEAIKPPREIETAEPKKFTTQDNTLVIPVPPEGSYTWRVRALAGINAQKKAGAQGPVSEAELETFRRSGD